MKIKVDSTNKIAPQTSLSDLQHSVKLMPQLIGSRLRVPEDKIPPPLFSQHSRHLYNRESSISAFTRKRDSIIKEINQIQRQNRIQEQQTYKYIN